MKARLRRVAAALTIVVAVAVCTGAAIAAEPPRQADPDATAISRALEAGAYGEAEPLAAARAARIDAAAGAGSIEAARAGDLLIEALIRNGRVKDPETLRRARRVLLLKERHLGLRHAELVASLNNLAELYLQRGEYATALTVARRAGSIAAAAFGADRPQIAESLDREALALIRLERFHEAERALTRSRRIRQLEADRAPLALAGTLYLVALLHRHDGHYPVARLAIDEALTIWRARAPEHPDTAVAEQLLGDLRFLDGDVVGARAMWMQGLSRAERALRPDHPALARFLRPLSLAASALGDLVEARALLERARTIGDRSLAECDAEVPGILSDLASVRRYDGDYPQAQVLYGQALAVVERCLGPTHSLVANILHNQGNLAIDMGDLLEAQRLHQRAVRLWTAGLGPDHQYVARGLDALAEVAVLRKSPTLAASLYQRALAIRRRALGAAHPDVAWTLANLARVEAAAGNLELARSRVAEAVAIYKSGGASQEPDHLVRVVLLRGSLEMRQGEYRAARATFTEALAMRDRLGGAAHPMSAEANAALASADFALGAYRAALANALAAERTGREHLQSTARYLPERQAMAYASRRPRGLDLALSATAAGYLEETATVADALIQSRGVVLEELAARAHARVGTDLPPSGLDDALRRARRRFANLMLRSVRGEEVVSPALLDAVRREKEAAERALAGSRVDNARDRVGLDEVRRALPAGSAVVSFARYQRTVPLGAQLETSYIAFVLRSDRSTVGVVPLGSAGSLDQLIGEWREQARGSYLSALPPVTAERRYREVATRLRKRIWDPIAAGLGDVSQVFIVPDGAINLVTFAALPADGGGYLIEGRQVMHYLAAERDLTSVPDRARGEGLVAVGGAAFNDGATAPAVRANSRSSCLGPGGLTFGALPGTREEVREVARIWESAAVEPGGNRTRARAVTLLTGTAATEPATVSAFAGRRIVHLATHGFFLDATCGPGMAGTRGVGSLASRTRRQPAESQSPLVLSGLAFAGANRVGREAAGDDGILTAEEVAGLEMRGTEWVVLSACDTGLGEITAGEGVVGLRRAFHIAGAQTVIMSLWSVEDQSARSWMRELYQARFERRLSTPAAMRAASLRVLSDRRARQVSSHPFYWAGFVAAGAWQ